MGLNTDFNGKFILSRRLTPEHKVILEEFAETEHEVDKLGRGLDGKPNGVYCQWVPTEDGTGLEWDQGEKFYYYSEWLEYLISHFLGPWGYTVSGTVQYVGTTEGVEGAISVQDNQVTVTRTPMAEVDDDF